MNRSRTGMLVKWAAGVILAGGVLLAGGCARYEFDLLEAPALDGVPADPELISPDNEVTIERLPLRYRMQVVENRLVVRVFNSSEGVVEVVGGRSVVVDPMGLSHPLRTTRLPPGAFVKLILPPVRPQTASRDGVSVHGGGGFGPGLDRSEFGFGATAGVGGPGRYTPRDGSDTYWEWSGEGSARLSLTFRDPADGREWTHAFRFGRRREP